MKRTVLCTLFLSAPLWCITQLSDLTSLSKKREEFPANSEDNWLHPTFERAHGSLGPTFIDRFLGKQKPIVKTLQNLLQRYLMYLQEKKIPSHAGIKLNVEPESQCVIWGHLSGGFHSLIRSIQFLASKGLIDNSLQLKNKNTYLVFNGNSINGGPYNVETLIALLLLMNKNPEKVFYLKGKNESKSAWLNGSLKDELQQRGLPEKRNQVPLQKELGAFFDALPSVIYVATGQEPETFIRISPQGRDSIEIKETHFAHELKKNSTNLSWFNLDHVAPKNNATLPNVISIIKEEDWKRHHIAKKGLAQLPDDRSSTAWAIFSSPIEAHQKLIDFSYDALAMLTIKAPITTSTITLFNRKKGDKQSFEPAGTFNISSGIEIQKDKTTASENYFPIGSSMALVQGVPIMGQRTKRGMDVRLKKENSLGGVNNVLLRTTVYNDNYTPKLTRNNITRLVNKNKVDTILLPVGSPTLASYLDYVRDNKVLVLFPITGGPQFRDPELKNIVHFRGTYADEVRALVDYMVQEGAAKKFAFFYQDDAYGKGPLKAAHEELEKKGITQWVDVPYQRNSVDYKKQAQKIREAQPDAIGFFSTGEATRELIRQIGIDFLTNKQLFGISFLGEESFRRFLDHTGLKVLFGAVVPNPNTSDLEIVKEYREAMDRNGLPYDIFSLEAYITTSIMLDAMKKITPPITKEKILAELEKLNNYQFKGLSLTFDPQRRDLAKYIWLESGKNKEWVQKEIDKNNQRKKEEDARSIDTSGSEQLSPRSASAPSQSVAP